MSSIKIIGICGKKFNGKDTIADYLVKKYGYTKISLSDPLKYAIKEIFNFSDEQLWGNKKEDIDPFWKVTPREVLQLIGTDCFRDIFGKKFPHIGDNIWVLSLQLNIDKLINSGVRKIVVPDIRFPNESELLKKYNGAIVRVNRIFHEKFISDSHISENSIDHIIPDYVILNNSIPQTFIDIDNIMKIM